MAEIYRAIRCESSSEPGSIRFLSDRIKLQDGQTTSMETLTRVIKFKDSFYGEVNITRKMLLSMVENFNKKVYGQDIMIDVSHMPSNGSAGTITKLFVERNKLRAEIEWTQYGIEAVTKRGFKYFSAEYHENYEDQETGKEYGPTLLGAGLTTRPRVKNLDPVSLKLSFDINEDDHYSVSPYIEKILSEEITIMWKEYLKKLSEKLKELKLSDSIITKLSEGFNQALEGITEEAKAKLLMESFVQAGTEVAEQMISLSEGQSPVINLSIPDANQSGLTADDVKKLLADNAKEQDDRQKKLQEDLGNNVKLFTDSINAVEGLPEDIRKRLLSASDLITADMTSDQVKKMAEYQIQMGNDMAVQAQLASQGYQVQGNAHITVEETQAPMALQEDILVNLRSTSAHANRRLVLCEDKDLHPFVKKVLGEFDRLNARQLAEERKAMAGGSTATSDTSLPVGFQRTVIREALSDFRVLSLINTLTDPGATQTTDIPYELRDGSAIQNNGVVYEKNPIHRASVSQQMDLAYIVPMKLAFEISNEVMHFTRASAINWDSYSRNVESNARFVRELMVRRICNELQRSADAYLAANIANEGFDGQLDGATVHTIKTASFPIVRPHQDRKVDGTAVGAAENAMIVNLNGAPIDEYDGTGTQPVATYYRVTSYNMGYIQFVDKDGTPVTPANSAGSDDISYSYATNVIKFDLDNGAVDIDLHLNGLLRAIGARKALLSGDRFINPNFMLMKPTLNDTVSNARLFEAQSKKNGTDTNNDGDLEMVKGIPSFGTNAPNVDLGDERIIMGERGVLTYTVAKPFMTGPAFESVDSTTGRPTGQKQAYGEEYSAIKVPAPIRNRLTSVLAYSATGR